MMFAHFCPGFSVGSQKGFHRDPKRAMDSFRSMELVDPRKVHDVRGISYSMEDRLYCWTGGVVIEESGSWPVAHG